jgi:phosphatidylinositol glycan class N
MAKAGLPLGAQVTGWVVLVTSLVLPFAHSFSPNNHYLHRLVVIFLAFAPMFIILTISYEGLFYFAFSCTLITWVRLEHRVYRSFTTRASPVSAVDASAPTDRVTAPEKHEYRSLTLADASTSYNPPSSALETLLRYLPSVWMPWLVLFPCSIHSLKEHCSL